MIHNVLVAKYNSDAPDEPADPDAFIGWLLDEKTEFTESGFNVNY